MELFYREYGNGKPLLILHGLYSMSDNWVLIARKLKDKFRVIIPDLRNHGNSPHSEDMSPDSMADDVKQLIEKLELKNIPVVGHSMGGKVAMLLADKYPHLVSKIIVIDMPPKSHVAVKEEQRFALHHKILSEFKNIDLSKFKNIKEIKENFIDRFQDEAVGAIFLKNIVKKGDSFGWKMNIKVISEKIDDILDFPENFKIQTIKATFIKAGKSDYIKKEDIEIIKKLYPKADIIEIQGAEHAVHASNPLTLCEILKKIV